MTAKASSNAIKVVGSMLVSLLKEQSVSVARYSPGGSETVSLRTEKGSGQMPRGIAFVYSILVKLPMQKSNIKVTELSSKLVVV